MVCFDACIPHLFPVYLPAGVRPSAPYLGVEPSHSSPHKWVLRLQPNSCPASSYPSNFSYKVLVLPSMVSSENCVSVLCFGHWEHRLVLALGQAPAAFGDVFFPVTGYSSVRMLISCGSGSCWEHESLNPSVSSYCKLELFAFIVSTFATCLWSKWECKMMQPSQTKDWVRVAYSSYTWPCGASHSIWHACISHTTHVSRLSSRTGIF